MEKQASRRKNKAAWMACVLSLGVFGGACDGSTEAAQAELIGSRVDTGRRDAPIPRPRLEPTAAAAVAALEVELARTHGEARARTRVRLHDDYAEAIRTSGRSQEEMLAEAIRLRAELLGSPQAEEDFALAAAEARGRGEAHQPTSGDLEAWARPLSEAEEAAMELRNREAAEQIARDAPRLPSLPPPAASEIEGARRMREAALLGPELAAARSSSAEACHAE